MEEAAELSNYLPLSFKTPKEQEYIEFLWDAFETNYTHGKYQFAFLAYHMLTMSFVYFNIWQIKQTEPKDFAMGLIGFGKDIEKSLLEATSPFVFSTVNERSILRFLKLIACDNSKIGTYAKLVDDRNDTAHPTATSSTAPRGRSMSRSPKSSASSTRSSAIPSQSSSTAIVSFSFRTTTPRNASIPMRPTRSARSSSTATTSRSGISRSVSHSI
jgi:hypothetical protein